MPDDVGAENHPSVFGGAGPVFSGTSGAWRSPTLRRLRLDHDLFGLTRGLRRLLGVRPRRRQRLAALGRFIGPPLFELRSGAIGPGLPVARRRPAFAAWFVLPRFALAAARIAAFAAVWRSAFAARFVLPGFAAARVGSPI